jgi:hypothetical protein
MSASNGSAAEIDQRLVWYACVFGAYLSGEITHRAQIGTCHYCGCERTGVTRSFLRAHFKQTSSGVFPVTANRLDGTGI